MPRKIFGPKRQEVTGTSGNCIIWSVMARNQTLFRSSNRVEMGGRRGRCWWVGNTHTFLVLELEKDHLKDPDVDGWIILNLWRRNYFFFNFSTFCI